MDLDGYRSFLVRLWREQGADGSAHWCGEAEHIQSGLHYYFTTLEAMLDCLAPDELLTPPPVAPPEEARRKVPTLRCASRGRRHAPICNRKWYSTHTLGDYGQI
ncbi:hypothetical protein HC891_15140 [Candidatus Gracilibacteria bacterium]|nr:hypothetical protein [Candidatus Gracilibacteria bacterium]